MSNVVVYLTPRLGVGQRLSLATIDRRLRELPLRQSLVLLSEMCSKAEAASVWPIDVRRQVELASHVFPSSFLAAAERRLSQELPRVVALSPQAIVLVGLRLLSVSEAESRDQEPDVLARRLGALCLAISDHIDEGANTAETTILEVLRLGMFYGQSGHPGWLHLSDRLFFDVLPDMTDDPEWCDPLSRFEAGTGLRLERFWAITSVQAGAAMHADDMFLFPLDIREAPIGQLDLDAWRRLLSQSLSQATEAAKADMAQPLGWSMSTVWKRPVIDLGQGRGPTLRPALLQMQTEPAQMFWHVRDVLVEQGVKHVQWSSLYGRAVERLGLRLLTEHVARDEVLNEDVMVSRWSIPRESKRADAAIRTAGGDLVMIDFVARQFTRETRSTGDFNALAKDLKLGVTEKLAQVDATLRYALDVEGDIRRVFPLIVTAGPFPRFPPLDHAVDRELERLGATVIQRDPRCRRWMVLDLLNFLLLLRICRLKGLAVADVLDDWQRSPLAQNEFREWALLSGPARGLPGGGLPDDWRSRIAAILGLTKS